MKRIIYNLVPESWSCVSSSAITIDKAIRWMKINTMMSTGLSSFLLVEMVFDYLQCIWWVVWDNSQRDSLPAGDSTLGWEG
jgi:hypothetical protein